MENTIEQIKPSFLRNHADTLTIIGVNIAIAAFVLNLTISTSHRVDAANARMDAYNIASDQRFEAMQKMIYDEMKSFHGRMCTLEEKNKNKG